MGERLTVEIQCVTSDRWDDLTALFATSTVTRSCWCMWPRVPVGDMHGRTEGQNREGMQAIVDGGSVPGLLAYMDGDPAGWCSIAPCRDYLRCDPEACSESDWMIACFFLRGDCRGRGIGSALLDGAVRYASERGAATVYGLPRGWRPDDAPSTLQGAVKMFRNAGFRDSSDPHAPAMMQKDV
jgi:GNAT superfamily N-acetyltransferase